jgi:hypothetical protein
MLTQNFLATKQHNPKFLGWQVLALKPDMVAFWANPKFFGY